MVVKILIGIVAIIVLLLILALFLKKKYNIERSILINLPRQEVFAYVKLLKNHDNFNKWSMQDPQMKKDFIGTDGTVGFIYAWNGDKKVGEGEQEITSISEGHRLDSELRFKRPFKSEGKSYLITDSISENQTKVTWGIEGKSSFPMNLMTFIMESLLRKDIQTSLGYLKNKLENNQSNHEQLN